MAANAFHELGEIDQVWHREYTNWRGIPKPRRCPFCKQGKGEIKKVRGGFQGVCPNCGATGPNRESHHEALKAWNGRA